MVEAMEAVKEPAEVLASLSITNTEPVGLPAPVLAQSAEGALPAVQGGDAETLVGRWLKYLDVSPKSALVYSGAIRVFLRWLRDRGIVSPGRANVLAYRVWLKQAHAPTTVSLYMTAVRLLSAWAEQEGVVVDVAQRVKGAKVPEGHACRLSWFTTFAGHGSVFKIFAPCFGQAGFGPFAESYVNAASLPFDAGAPSA